jgi:hypothetical protein
MLMPSGGTVKFGPTPDGDDCSPESIRRMLSAMTGEPVTEGTTLVKPLPAMPADYTLKSRPEMKMFDAQSGLLDGQTSLY